MLTTETNDHGYTILYLNGKSTGIVIGEINNIVRICGSYMPALNACREYLTHEQIQICEQYGLQLPDDVMDIMKMRKITTEIEI